MPTLSICFDCGAEITTGSQGGLCTRCLFMHGLGSATEPEAETLNPPSGDQAKLNPEASTSFTAETRRLGDYELLEEIARGGMGVVYRARQVSLDRIVAVKVILAGRFASREAVLRFRAEAEEAAGLKHPNIVAIHDTGEEDGQPYFSMDYVTGGNLAALVLDRPLESRAAARLVHTLAEAIHYAHDRGILHRDLKPSNVLLDDAGRPVITDFGLARRATKKSFLTVTGQVLGSPNYMPPEQAGAMIKSGRYSDVYALGGILFFLLTGRPPFLAESVTETLQHVLHTEPLSPRLLNPGVPTDLATICLKCLEKPPERRYQSARDLADDLRRFLEGDLIMARPVSWVKKIARWSSRRPAVAALVVLLNIALFLGAAGIVWQWRRAERNAQSERTQLQRANESVVELRAQRIEDLLKQDDAATALSHLAQMVRQEPANSIAGARLISLLSQRSFPLPSAPPLAHGGPVNWADFSPDGARIVTASEDGTARVWNVKTGEGPLLILKHTDPIHTARYSPDGRKLVTASADQSARIWGAETGQFLNVALAHPGSVLDAIFDPDGTTVVTTATDRIVRLWAVGDGALLHSFPQTNIIRFARFSRDGLQLIVGSGEGLARVYDPRTGRTIASLVHQEGLTSADISPDGQLALTGGYSHQARLWRVPTGRLVAECFHDLDVVESVAFSPTGGLFATGGRDRTVRLWDVETGRQIGRPMVHDSVVVQIEFSRDGRRLLAQCQSSTVWVWEIEGGVAVGEPLRHEAPLKGARLSPEGQRVVVFGPENAAYLWDVRPGVMQPLWLSHNYNVVRAQFSPDGRSVATASEDNSARVWDSRTGQPVTAPLEHGQWVTRATFDVTSKWLLTSAIDGTAAVWDARSGVLRCPPIQHGLQIESSEFSPDGRRFVTTARDGTLQVWDSPTGRPLWSPRQDGNGWIYTGRFSPDGRFLVTTSEEGWARIWEVETGQPIGEILQHGERVRYAEFSPDGQKVVTGSYDMTARIWDTKTGRALFPPLRHQGRVRQASFSPDGTLVLSITARGTAHLWNASTGASVGDTMKHRLDLLSGAFDATGQRVVTASADNTARIWDGRTGRPLSEPFRHEFMVYDANFSPDGRWIVTASADHTARLWEVPEFTASSPPWLADLAEAVTGLRRDEAGREAHVSVEEFLRLRRRLENPPDSQGEGSWVRWFLADRSTRSLSPNSPITIPEQVERCVTENGEEGLRLALRLDPTNERALARYVRRSLTDHTNLPASALAGLEYDTRMAIERKPDYYEAWWARAEVLERQHRTDEALLAVRRTIALRPADVALQIAMSGLLNRLGKDEDALNAADKAVRVATADGLAPHLLKSALENRQMLGNRVNRSGEAPRNPDRNQAKPPTP